jgi:hypothetical protein
MIVKAVAFDAKGKEVTIIDTINSHPFYASNEYFYKIDNGRGIQFISVKRVFIKGILLIEGENMVALDSPKDINKYKLLIGKVL